MAAKTTTEKTTTNCRGKWSACKGANPSKSVKWHLCTACTERRAVKMGHAKPKAAKPATVKADAKHVEALKVACPRCNAEATTPCIWGATHSKGRVHADRIRLMEATTTVKS